MVLAVLVLRLGVSKAQAGLLNPLTLLAFVRGSLKVWLLLRCYQARVTESRRRHYVTHPSWGLPLFFGCLGSASAASGASRTRLLISRFKVRALGGSPNPFKENGLTPSRLRGSWSRVCNRLAVLPRLVRHRFDKRQRLLQLVEDQAAGPLLLPLVLADQESGQSRGQPSARRRVSDCQSSFACMRRRSDVP